jgi:hypothetical protein
VPQPSVSKINHPTILSARSPLPVFLLLFHRFTPSIRSEEEPSDPTSPMCVPSDSPPINTIPTRSCVAAGLSCELPCPNTLHLRRRHILLDRCFPPHVRRPTPCPIPDGLTRPWARASSLINYHERAPTPLPDALPQSPLVQLLFDDR